MLRTARSGFRTAGRWPGPSTAARAGCPACWSPDTGSSRLAPGWLLHDSALPAAIRLLAMDRPGIGVSDPIGFGGTEQPAEDLRRMVETLAVGRVAVIGIGQGADDAFAFAARYPALVTSVSAVSVRPPSRERRARMLLHPFARRQPRTGPGRWRPGSAAGKDADLTPELTWSRMLDRLDASVRPGAGDRWRESDFREAVAADAAQINRRGPRRPGSSGPPQWVLDPAAVRVPVSCGTASTRPAPRWPRCRSSPTDRRAWTVRPAAGSSAVLGAWTGILEVAAKGVPRAS